MHGCGRVNERAGNSNLRGPDRAPSLPRDLAVSVPWVLQRERFPLWPCTRQRVSVVHGINSSYVFQYRCQTLSRKSPRASSSSLVFVKPPIVGGRTDTPFSVTLGLGFLIPAVDATVYDHLNTMCSNKANAERQTCRSFARHMSEEGGGVEGGGCAQTVSTS